MLGDVIEAARRVGRVVVVTDDVSAVPRGVQRVVDPGSGLGAAVASGLRHVEGHALVLNADLPCATRDAIETLAAAGLALVEASDGTTNALSLPDAGTFVPLYGAGSAERFRAHAPFSTVRIPELEADVDTEDDLDRIRLALGPRTRALLAVTA
jgi:2-phospho-L-lactate guanylyltransferase (CobY/MobA/RfbA family)